MARRPRGNRAGIGRDDRIVGKQLVEFMRDDLRLHRGIRACAALMHQLAPGLLAGLGALQERTVCTTRERIPAAVRRLTSTLLHGALRSLRVMTGKRIALDIESIDLSGSKQNGARPAGFRHRLHIGPDGILRGPIADAQRPVDALPCRGKSRWFATGSGTPSPRRSAERSNVEAIRSRTGKAPSRPGATSPLKNTLSARELGRTSTQ